MLIDTHCHLDFPGLAEDVPGVLARAHEQGVSHIVTISTHVSRAATYQALAEAHDTVFFTIGTHPHQAAIEPDVPVETYVSLSQHPKCVAIGEGGLDYFYEKSPRDVQDRVFRKQIAAARQTGLPIIIHARDADEDMIALLQNEMGKGAFTAILHCFSSGEKLADAGLELGFSISFSGILTFKKSDALRAIAARVPLDRLLVETDAPYLAPDPWRGKTNEPAYVRRTAEVLAQVKGVSLEELGQATTDNFRRVFDKAII